MRLTVIVPVYQAEKVLKRLLNSILEQDCKDYEILLIDDGSTDGSGAICDEFATKYDHVSVIHKNNGGVSSARNEGIKNAKGQYVVFLDADDYIDKGYFKDIMYRLENSSLDLLVYNYFIVSHEKSQEIKSSLNGTFNRQELCQNINKFILDSSFNSPCNKVFKRSIINEHSIFFPNQKIAEDGIFVCNYLKYTNLVNFIDSTYYRYINNDSSTTRQYCESRWSDETNYLFSCESLMKKLGCTDLKDVMGIKYRNAILFDVYNLVLSKYPFFLKNKILNEHLMEVYDKVNWAGQNLGDLVNIQLRLLKHHFTMLLLFLLELKSIINKKFR